MITLYTSTTPNGYKISIALEEMGGDYKVVPVSLSKLEQKEDWFLKLNPNGRIPVIVDHDNNDFVVFESGAILWYLANKFQKLIPQDPNKASEVLQWVMYQMGGLGPMQGQAHVFYRYAEEKIPFAINRYQNETKRLYTVLDTRLKDRDFLVDEYSIADICNYTWVRSHEWAGVSIDDLPNLSRWLDTISARKAVQRGLNVPPKEEESAASKAANAKKMVQE